MQTAADLDRLQGERAALLHADLHPRGPLVVWLDRDVLRLLAVRVAPDELDDVVNRALRAWLSVTPR